MKRIKSNFHALHVLKSASPKLRKAVIENSNKELVYSIAECALNVLKGRCNLSECTKRKLRKHRVLLRRLSDRRVPLTSKKRLIVQRGGFLLPLLTAVLSGLTNLFMRPKNNAA